MNKEFVLAVEKCMQEVHNKTAWICNVPLCHSGDLIASMERLLKGGVENEKNK